MSKPRLMTSNEKKLREYRRLGLDAELGGVGPDLPEVQAGPVEVAMRKALMCGEGALAEDTSLDVEGVEVGVDVRWLMDSIGSLAGKKAVFRVVLAHCADGVVKAFQGEVHGLIIDGQGEQGGFGFDRFFAPEGAGMSLLALDRLGRKDEFSARALAAKAYQKGLAVEARAVEDFKPWTGSWQGAKPARP